MCFEDGLPGGELALKEPAGVGRAVARQPVNQQA